nr:hypothetical protein [Agaribacterium haliotis]
MLIIIFALLALSRFYFRRFSQAARIRVLVFDGRHYYVYGDAQSAAQSPWRLACEPFICAAFVCIKLESKRASVNSLSLFLTQNSMSQSDYCRLRRHFRSLKRV